jgi:hypothetical protein
VSILDIRGDGSPSLFLGNAPGVRFPSVDHIFLNVGKRFVDRRTGGLPSEQNTVCSSTGDFDHDGREDLLSCSSSLRLYRNLTTRAGRVSYRQVAAGEGITARPRKTDAELIDLNRDAWRDLVTVTDDALAVRLNRRRSPHFPKVDFRFPLTAGFSFCSGRANRDRAPDLLVVQGLVKDTDKFQRPDWMLINSGSSKRFRALPVPGPPFRKPSPTSQEAGRRGRSTTAGPPTRPNGTTGVTDSSSFWAADAVSFHSAVPRPARAYDVTAVA